MQPAPAAPSFFDPAPQIVTDSLSRYLQKLQITFDEFGHQQNDPGAECGPRVTGDIELIWYRGGRGIITVGERRYECGRGALLIIPPYVLHEIRTLPADPHENYYLHFDVEPLYERDRFLALLLPADGGYHLSIDEDGPTAAVLTALTDELSGGESGRVAAASGLVLALFAMLIRRAHAGSPSIPLPPIASGGDRTILDRAIPWIDAHIGEAIDVSWLAEEAGCSRSALYQAFERLFAISPMRFVQWTRLRSCERLLRSTDRSLKEISDSVGFSSPFHLSRQFKARYGVSPSEYRTASRR